MSAGGFQGCLGSLDCMHWYWDNSPKALKGLYRGRCKKKA